MSSSLGRHGLQHARPPCPSPTPGAYSFMPIEWLMPSNHLILCCPLLPPSIFPSIRIFSSESVLRIRWPKYSSFSFSISPSNEYLGLIFFRMDWLDAQGHPRSWPWRPFYVKIPLMRLAHLLSPSCVPGPYAKPFSLHSAMCSYDSSMELISFIGKSLLLEEQHLMRC